jgi:lipopolysaccharide/colanic/teichoic acid biosynthesis glycosyltransferase
MTTPQRVKRAFDIVVASVSLIAGAPIMALVILLIMVLEGRPIFYVSRRCVAPDRTIPI